MTRSFPHRRDILAGAAAVATLPGTAWPAPTRPFLTLSSTLLATGDLDPDEAGDYEKALRAGSHGAQIARLVALATMGGGPALLERIKGEGLEEAANLVVAAWYSGMVGGTVVTYTDALAWNAVPFTKPNGSCGGAFGYWAQPPTN
ncbi:MAG: hypothetical protein KIT25_07325 [Enhydrobacter sp.]|nr:MAG: hypothetical protein KIT25_07325 [Enhydrobacter sp.]